LQALIDKCRTPDASQTDRLLRDALLKSTVDLYRRQVKMWAYGQLAASHGRQHQEDVDAYRKENHTATPGNRTTAGRVKN
jgi:hypothetical protein